MRKEENQASLQPSGPGEEGVSNGGSGQTSSTTEGLGNVKTKD